MVIALIYSGFSTNVYPQRILIFKSQTRILFHEVLENKTFPLFIVEKKTEAVLLVPDLKTKVKWTLVLICGRFYINAYSQGKIIFEIQMIMVFNEALENIYVFVFRPVKKKWVTSGFGLKVMVGGSLFYLVKIYPR